MPTPSDTTVPIARVESLSRTSFTSCPPDERDFLPARDARPDDGDGPGTNQIRVNIQSAEHTDTVQDRPEIDASVTSTDLNDLHLEEHTKDTQCEDARQNTLDPASSAASPFSASECESASPPPQLSSKQPVLYMEDALCRTRQPSITTSFLRPGSKFHGTQRSDRQVYDVQVEVKDVDLAESFLCGYLRIQGLTDDHPTLTTFFEGEIIGPKHLFKTTHPSWGSTEKVDLQHWARFPAWRPLAKSAKSPNFTLNNFQQREHLFMRWKEYFLVPDHRVKTITGASFEGFYYICFNQCDGRVSGIYFHAKSEKYQQLELQHVEDYGCMGAVQFR